VKWSLVLFLATLSSLAGSTCSQDKPPEKVVTVGFIEGGEYPDHAVFRDLFTAELQRLVPEGLKAVTVPQGFKSAGWRRDTCRSMAAEIAGDTSVHMVVALGPWVVEDLLAAGCQKPIIAAYRFDPVLEGLVDARGRPIVDNLTLRVRPDKLKNDLALLAGLLPVKELAFLYFPSGDETERVLAEVRRLAADLGFSVVTAEGYDNYGTFAYFKAYGALAERVDALYVPPLWGFTPVKINQFYARTNRERVPVMSASGRLHVERGALVSGNGESIRANAYFHAWKTVRIMQGETPADLPVVFPEQTGIVVNGSTARLYGLELPAGLRFDAVRVEIPQGEDSLAIDLPSAIDQALTLYPGYLARHEALQAAAARARRAYSEYLPQVGLTGSITYFDDNAVHNRFGEIDNESYRLGLTLEQSLLSLETIRTIELAAEERKLSEISRDQAGLDLEFAVTTAYVGFLRAWGVLAARQEYRDRIDEILQLARTREFLGIQDHFEVLRWQDEHLRATQALIGAEADLGIARVVLNILLNQPGNTPIVPDSALFSQERLVAEYVQLLLPMGTRSAEERSQDFLVRQALAENPALRRLGVNIDIQHVRVSRNRARWYPRVGFRATLQYADELAESPSFQEESSQWSVGAFFDLPLFEGADRWHERRMLTAELGRVENEKDEAILNVISRVRTEMLRFGGLLARLPFADESWRLAADHSRQAADGYASGRRTYIEVLEAQRSYLDARLTMLETRHDYCESAARLVRAVGWSAHAHGRTPGQELAKRLAAPDSGR